MVNNINNSFTANHKKKPNSTSYTTQERHLLLFLFFTVMLTNFVSLIFSVQSSSNGCTTFFLRLQLE